MTRCPGCGTVRVSVGAWHRTVKLASVRLHRRAIMTLPAFVSGTSAVVITVTSTGKRVEIDGLGTSRF